MELRPSDREGGQERSPRRQRFVFGPWVFNVDRGLAIVAEHAREAKALPVEPWTHFYGLDATGEEEGIPLFAPMNLDRDYAMTTDLDEPVLVATLRSSLNKQFPLLIHGTHRLYRAYVEHVAELPAYVLTVEESLAIREDGFIGSSVYWPSHDQGRLPSDAAEPDDGGS